MSTTENELSQGEATASTAGTPNPTPLLGEHTELVEEIATLRSEIETLKREALNDEHEIMRQCRRADEAEALVQQMKRALEEAEKLYPDFAAYEAIQKALSLSGEVMGCSPSPSAHDDGCAYFADLCPECDGTGERDTWSGARCHECNGKGWVRDEDDSALITSLSHGEETP